MKMNPLLSTILFICFHQSLATTYITVTSLGARGDGRYDSTNAFLSAWDMACGYTRPVTIYVPQGRYLIGRATFEGHCKNNATTFRIDGTLVAPSNYQVLGYGGYWIVFVHVNGVSIRGGTLDGQGNALWACKASRRGCPSGATSIEFSNSNNILISGLTSLNSQMFHVVINGCNNVRIQGMKVLAPGNSPNTDGIHVAMSSNVTIWSSKISTGDDCISIGPGTSNLWIENISCGPGHGISIGSLGRNFQEPGVENVTVKAAYFMGTQNGVRIKTWAKDSNAFVRGVLYQQVTMINVQNPIIIDQNYCPGNYNCPNLVSGVRISNVTYQNIRGSSATEVGVKLDCSRNYPCNEVRLENVHLTYRNQPIQASCVNAVGSASDFVQSTNCL